MHSTPSGRLAPIPEPLAYADGLTAARYCEPDPQDDNPPDAIPQAPGWQEGRD